MSVDFNDTRAVPFTVLLLIPDHMRDDECCEADWVRRIWVQARNHEEAMGIAQDECTALLEMDADEAQSLAPIAIYHGHIFDVLEV
jgi:hypothetical protein